jgi:hypothetical protein
LSFLPTKILKGRKVKAAEYETDHSRKILTKLLNSDYSKERHSLLPSAPEKDD